LLCDHPRTIWDNNQPDTKRIATSFLKRNKPLSSLLLIKPESASIGISHYEDEINFRALFGFNKIDYAFPLTDLKVGEIFEDKSPGIYKLTAKDIYLCISLGEPFRPGHETEEYCYKLVAAIITT
jgi:hypothetical protein